jgi:26S proteasome regulatory subunit N10
MSTLEAVMICLDNSEFARNADYAPSRLEAQTDAANLISGAKTQAHPENVVGVALMSGERVEVKLNPCTDIGKVLSVLASVGVAEGSETCDLIRSIQTCSIALKHRQNKNQKQRLICFIASPLVGVSEKQLEQVGKVLKKNNVAIDVVSIGDTDNVNRERLQKLVEVADSSANPCRFVEVESNSGKHLSDVIVSSPILGGGSSSGGADMLSGGVGFDANMDPELAMAIRLSMEEERQRQSAAVVAGTDQPSVSSSSSSQIVVEEDFDAELRAALLASLQEVAPPAPQVVETNVDEELRKALQESAEDWEGDKEPKKAKTSSETAASGEEEQLLASLPGVDMSDPRIQEALKKNNKKSTQ